MKNATEFLGLWKWVNNPEFKVVKFEWFRKKVRNSILVSQNVIPSNSNVLRFQIGTSSCEEKISLNACGTKTTTNTDTKGVQI